MMAKKLILAAAVYCTGLGVAQAQSLADFDCQVATESGARGLVMVTAATAKEAKKMAIGKSAYTERTTLEISAEVVECVNRTREETFSDYRFEWWSTNEVDR